MSILVNKNTKVICQGFTGDSWDLPFTNQAIAYGTQMVGRCHHPARAAPKHLGLPVYRHRLAAAREKTGADASVIYVPASVCGGLPSSKPLMRKFR